jgi:hypothetical protein
VKAWLSTLLCLCPAPSCSWILLPGSCPGKLPCMLPQTHEPMDTSRGYFCQQRARAVSWLWLTGIPLRAGHVLADKKGA